MLQVLFRPESKQPILFHLGAHIRIARTLALSEDIRTNSLILSTRAAKTSIILSSLAEFTIGGRTTIFMLVINYRYLICEMAIAGRLPHLISGMIISPTILSN